MTTHYPNDVLQALLTEVSLGYLDFETRQVLLTGFLTHSGIVKVPTEKFDAAADRFLSEAGLGAEDWCAFLGVLIARSLEGDEAWREFERYLKAQVHELAAALAPPASAEQPKPVELWITLTDNEAGPAVDWLASKKPLNGTRLGLALLDWRVESGEEAFQVQLVNCEGGPCLIGYRRRGARIVDSTRPQYSLTEPFVFALQSPEVTLRLRLEPKPSDPKAQ